MHSSPSLSYIWIFEVQWAQQRVQESFCTLLALQMWIICWCLLLWWSTCRCSFWYLRLKLDSLQEPWWMTGKKKCYNGDTIWHLGNRFELCQILAPQAQHLEHFPQGSIRHRTVIQWFLKTKGVENKCKNRCSDIYYLHAISHDLSRTFSEI